jgi:hypothetical protein
MILVDGFRERAFVEERHDFEAKTPEWKDTCPNCKAELDACGKGEFEACDLGFVDMEARREVGFETVEGDELVFCFGGQEESSGVEAVRVYC